jgi:hypothetical protein
VLVAAQHDEEAPGASAHDSPGDDSPGDDSPGDDSPGDDSPGDDSVGDDGIGRIAGGDVSPPALLRLALVLGRSARQAGARAVASGRWLAGTVLDAAPRIPIRDRATLEGIHGGLAGDALATELIRRASITSAAVGAASGTLMGAEELAPPAWLSIPVELVAETLAVAAVEMKLVGELHEVYGHPLPGSPDHRGRALVGAWAERRGVTPATLASAGGLSEALGRGTRHEVVRLVRRRLFRRLGRNLSSLAPFLAGAAAGAEVNRRATRSLGQAIVRDLTDAPGRR